MSADDYDAMNVDSIHIIIVVINYCCCNDGYDDDVDDADDR